MKNIYHFLLVIFLACSHFVTSAQQQVVQQGLPFSGTNPLPTIHAGVLVTMSADGTTAVSAYNASEEGTGFWVYRLNANQWVQQAHVRTPFWFPGNSNSSLGSMAISANGNTIAITKSIIASNYEDTIWVFSYQNSYWQLQAKLLPKPGCGNAKQKIAMSYDGNTLLYNAQIWVRSNNVWAIQATLAPFDRPLAANFCYDSANKFSGVTSSGLSADGNTAVIGDFYKPDSTTNAWVFVRTGTTWTQQGPRLAGTGNAGLSPNAASSNSTVAISGDGNTIGIGNRRDARVWVFKRLGTLWTEEQQAPASTIFSPGYGLAFSYNGSSYVTYNGDGFNYWNRSGSIWSRTGTENYIRYEAFFDSVGTNNISIYPTISMDSSGTKVFLGMAQYAAEQGGAWYFTLNNQNVWQQQGGRIYNPAGLTGANAQGQVMAMSGDGSTLAVAAEGDNGSEGAVWIYKRNGQQWTQIGPKLGIFNGSWQPRQFGSSVALSADGSILAVGAPNCNNMHDPFNIQSGNVYVYQLNGGVYVPMVDSLTAGGSRDFGERVAMSDDGNTLLVSTYENGGYIYVRNGNTWSQQAFLSCISTFGWPIAISADGNTAAISEKSYNNYKGAVSIFKRTGTTWVLQVSGHFPAVLSQQTPHYFPSSLSFSQNGDVLFAGDDRFGYMGNVFVTERSGSIWSGFDTIFFPVFNALEQYGSNVFSSQTGDTLFDFSYSYSYSLIFFTRNGSNWVKSTAYNLPFLNLNYPNNGMAGIAISGNKKVIAAGYNKIVNESFLPSTGEMRVYVPMNLRDSTLQIRNATCATVPDGKIRIAMLGGTAPYHFVWGNGAPDADSAVNLLPGIYNLTISDAAGDTILRQYTVNAARVPHTVNYSTAFNCNTGLGAINPIVTGGTTPYAYVWGIIPPQNNDTLLNALPGQYTYTVTDSAGCSWEDSAYLPATVAAWVSATSLPATCDNTDGAAIATMYGGNQPLAYSWSNGDNTAVINSLAAAVYNVTVTDATGCSVSAAVNVGNACISNIRGTVFFDRNNNCQHNTGEPYVTGLTMVATNGIYTLYGNTDSLGHYYIPVPDSGQYTVSVAHWQLCSYVLCSGSAYPVVTTVPGGGVAIADFPFLDTGIDLTLETETVEPYPGVSFNYTVYYGNQKDSIVPAGVVTLIYDAPLMLNTTTPAFTTHNAATRTITWNVSSIGFMHTYSQLVTANFTVPVTVSPGTWLTMHSFIEPVSSDCNPANNDLILPFRVNGSLDPNYKAAYPQDVLGPDDSTIIYTIHFQNTGIDSTHFIVISDTLSGYLDPASVRTVGAFHHPYVFDIKENGILTWTFSPYALPDSTTDPVNSQGYVSFIVSLKPGLPTGTVIANTAHIYFDYNEAVVTNKVVNNIDLCLGLTSTENFSADICHGEVFNFYGQALSGTGSYQKALINSKGCDSIIELNLNVLQVAAISVDTAVQSGGLYTLPDGSTTGAAGTYLDTLQAANGCDSVITTHLSVISGIGEPGALVDFTLRPNPASSYLVVGAPVALNSIIVYNTTGQQVLAIDKPQPQGAAYNYYVGVELLAAGTYVIEVKGNGASARRRWVKM